MGCTCHHIVNYCISHDDSVANLCFIPEHQHELLHQITGDRPNLKHDEFVAIAKHFGAIGVELK
jgi:hypothetical protein